MTAHPQSAYESPFKIPLPRTLQCYPSNVRASACRLLRQRTRSSSPADILSIQQQRAAITNTERISASTSNSDVPEPWDYGVKAKKDHLPHKIPIVWKDDHIQVLTTQWDYTKSEEIAYDCPFQVLKDLVIATAG